MIPGSYPIEFISIALVVGVSRPTATAATSTRIGQERRWEHNLVRWVIAFHRNDPRAARADRSASSLFARGSDRVPARPTPELDLNPSSQRKNAGSQMDFAEATRPLLGHLVSIARRILAPRMRPGTQSRRRSSACGFKMRCPRMSARGWPARWNIGASIWRGASRDVASTRFEPVSSAWRKAIAIIRRSTWKGRIWGRILEQALARIDADQRIVLVLGAVEQMDYESIATALQIPVGTVRSRMNRARRALRELLIHTLPEEYCVRQSSHRSRS